MNRLARIPPWTFALLILALAAALWTSGLSSAADLATVEWAVPRSRVEPWASRWNEITALGAWPGSLGVVAVVVLVASALSVRRIVPIAPRNAFAWAGLAIVGQLLNALLKLAFHRERPPTHLRLALETSYSFPSGHAFFAGAALGVLACLAWSAARPRSRGLAFGLVAACGSIAVLLASSRVALGVHYPTDIVGGLALGAAWADASWRVIRAGAHRSGSKAPPSGPG